MKINEPSNRWQSQKIALLEPISIWISSRLNVMLIVYFSAIGFYSSIWLRVNFTSHIGLTNFQVATLIASLSIIIISVPVLMVAVGLKREIDRRLNHS